GGAGSPSHVHRGGAAERDRAGRVLLAAARAQPRRGAQRGSRCRLTALVVRRVWLKPDARRRHKASCTSSECPAVARPFIHRLSQASHSVVTPSGVSVIRATLTCMGAGTATTDLSAELQRLFGFERFRPGQREAIEGTLSGRDVLAIMPTGS